MSSLRSNVALLYPSDPLRGQGYQDTLRAIRPENDPEKPPAKEPGDSYVVGLSMAGLLAGGGAGYLVALLIVGLPVWILCSMVGGLVGAAAGGLAGDAIKRQKFGRHK